MIFFYTFYRPINESILVNNKQIGFGGVGGIGVGWIREKHKHLFCSKIPRSATNVYTTYAGTTTWLIFIMSFLLFSFPCGEKSKKKVKWNKTKPHNSLPDNENKNKAINLVWPIVTGIFLT